MVEVRALIVREDMRLPLEDRGQVLWIMGALDTVVEKGQGMLEKKERSVVGLDMVLIQEEDFDLDDWDKRKFKEFSKFLGFSIKGMEEGYC